jgi:hypothetical protein
LLVTLLTFVYSTTTRSQVDPRPTYDSLVVPAFGAESDSVKTAMLGGSLGLTTGAGEALNYTGLGFGVQLNVGVSFGHLTELRIGGMASSFSDELSPDEDLANDRVKLYGLFVENLYKKRVSSFVLHVGLRVVWMWESRSIFTNTPTGPGIGLFAGGRRAINPRTSLEANVSWTSIDFSGANTPDRQDPDRQANGTVWDVRLGLAYFMNPER